MVRRILFLIFCTLAFIAGSKMEKILHENRCSEAGGLIQNRICIGITRK